MGKEPILFGLIHPAHEKPHLVGNPTKTMYKRIIGCAIHANLQNKVKMLTKNPFL